MTIFKLFHKKDAQLTNEIYFTVEMYKEDIFILNQYRFSALLAWKNDGGWFEVTFMLL